MIGWMKSTLSQPYIRRLFSSITVDDDVEEIEFEMTDSIDDGYD